MKTSSHYLCQMYEELDDTTAVQQLDRETFLLTRGDRRYQLTTDRHGRTVQAVQKRLEHLEKAGFNRYVPIVPTTDGEPVIQRHGFHWFLRPHYPPVCLDDPDQLQEVARTIASLHRCTADESGRSVVHGALCPEAVRRGPGGEVLLDLWEKSYRGEALGDLVDLVLMSADDDPSTTASIVSAYNRMKPLDEYRLRRLGRRLGFHGIEVPTHPGADSPGDPDESESEDRADREELLVRARRAAEEGRWNVTHEKDACSDRSDQVVDRETAQEAGHDPDAKAPETDVQEEITCCKLEAETESARVGRDIPGGETPAASGNLADEASTEPDPHEPAEPEQAQSQLARSAEAHDGDLPEDRTDLKEPLHWTFPPAITAEPDEKDPAEGEPE